MLSPFLAVENYPYPPFTVNKWKFCVTYHNSDNQLVVLPGLFYFLLGRGFGGRRWGENILGFRVICIIVGVRHKADENGFMVTVIRFQCSRTVNLMCNVGIDMVYLILGLVELGIL